jgi:hypothetical protein
MLTHERNKNSRTKRGCLVCFQLGTTGQSFAYINLEFIPMYAGKEIKPVVKEIGLCYKHTQECCDKEKGVWTKTKFGKRPVRDEVYELRTEAVESRRPSAPSENQPDTDDRLVPLYNADGTIKDDLTLVKGVAAGSPGEPARYRSAAPGSTFFKRVPIWW